MVATVAGIHLGIDTHANRPAANTVSDGSVYSCSTHGLLYKSNFGGNSWATWLEIATARGAGIYKSADQSNITSGTEAKVTFSTAEYDTDGYFDDANDRLTIPASLGGRYLLTGSLGLTGFTGASVDVLGYLKKSGTQVRTFWRGNVSATETDLSVSFAFALPLAVAEYIEMFVNPGSLGGNVVDIRSGIWTRLEATKLSA